MSIPEPPTYGGVPQVPFSPSGAITWGWRKFTQFLGPVMIGVAIYVGINAAGSAVLGVLSLALAAAGETTADSATASALESTDVAAQLVLNVGGLIVNVLLSGAAARAALDVADGREYDFVNAIGRVPVPKLIGTTLLAGLVIFIGLVVPALPIVTAVVLLDFPIWAMVIAVVVIGASGIALSVLLYLATWIVVDDPGTQVTDALRISASLVRSNVADAVVLGLLVTLIIIAGFVACCVGLVVAYPVTILATANAYRRFQGRSVAP